MSDLVLQIRIVELRVGKIHICGLWFCHEWRGPFYWGDRERRRVGGVRVIQYLVFKDLWRSPVEHNSVNGTCVFWTVCYKFSVWIFLKQVFYGKIAHFRDLENIVAFNGERPFFTRAYSFNLRLRLLNQWKIPLLSDPLSIKLIFSLILDLPKIFLELFFSAIHDRLPLNI